MGDGVAASVEFRGLYREVLDAGPEVGRRGQLWYSLGRLHRVEGPAVLRRWSGRPGSLSWWRAVRGWWVHGVELTPSETVRWRGLSVREAEIAAVLIGEGSPVLVAVDAAGVLAPLGRGDRPVCRDGWSLTRFWWRRATCWL